VTVPSEQGRSSSRYLRLIGKVACILIIASAVLYIFRTFSKNRICDDALASTGSVAKVCRHLQVTDPPIVAALAVAVIALALLFGFTEISALGISLKRSVAEAQRAESRATDAAEEASKARTATTSTAKRAEDTSIFAEALVLGGGAVAQGSDFKEQLENLQDEYDDIRKKEPSGSARTARMTTIVSRMIALFSRAGQGKFNLPPVFDPKDKLGKRIAKYAYVYTYPDPRATTDLVDAVVKERDHAFGQYWALRAIRKALITGAASLDQDSRQILEEYGKTIGPNTDRAYELSEILKAAPSE
jgi:Sec-independent protein translocase protein TatA